MQSSNPAFSQTFANNLDYSQGMTRTMTVQGTAIKTFVLLAIAMGTAAWSWGEAQAGTLQPGLAFGAGILAFCVALVTCFKPTLAAWTSPVYAALEGVFLGAISYAYNGTGVPHFVRGVEIPGGLAIQAVFLTGGVTLMMLTIYATGLIKVTGQLASAIMAATGAICLVYMASFVMRMFGVQMPYIHSAGPIGIGFSCFVVGLAAFNLLLDFDFIDRGSRAGLSKSMEWYGAFGLMVTMVWMYLEILRLLSKLNRR